MSPETNVALSSFFRRSLLTYGVQILSVLCSLANNFLLARALGPAGKGVTFLIIALGNALAFIMFLGLDRAEIYFLGRKLYPEDVVLETTTTLALMCGGLAICLYLVIPHHYSQFVARGLSLPLQAIALVAVPLLLLSLTWLFFSLALNEIRLYNLLRGILPLSFTLLLLPAYFILPHEVLPFALTWLSSSLLTAVVSFILLNRRVPIRLGFHRKLAAEAMVFGLKGQAGAVFGLFTLRLDVFILNYFWGASPLGIYSVGVAMAETLWNLPLAVSTVLRAEIPRAEATDANALTTWANRNTLWLSAAAGIVLYLVAPTLLHWFLPTFLGSLPVLAILMPGVIALTIHLNVSADLTNRGKPEVSTYTSAASAALAVGLYLWLIPPYGIWGAAAASTIAYIFNAAISLLAYNLLTGATIGEMLAFRIDDFRRYRDFTKDLWVKLSGKSVAQNLSSRA